MISALDLSLIRISCLQTVIASLKSSRIRAENGPGRPRAGPDNSNFADGRAGPSSRNLGPARPGSFPVGRVVCRGLCLVLPFPSV
jgi:hypothetical protein